ncbi:cellulose synthase [Aggregicoccus sp. 17bor-14]|uniref:cellulose synthase n=1 Tax=Myxococcaceae TaxID=31 RepID=UPI00351A3DD0
MALAALLLGGAVYAVVQHAVHRRLVETHVLAARDLALRGNPQDLNAALGELERLRAQDPDVPVAHALAADILTELWTVHRQPDTRVRAEGALARARALESHNGERYAAEVLLMLDAGRVHEADAFLTELERTQSSSPKLLLARGATLQALGRMDEARQALARAAEAGWQDPRYAVAYGETLLDDGRYAQAADAFARALTASPQHLGARTGSLLTQVLRRERLPEARRAVATLLEPRSELTPGMRARALAIRAELALYQRRADAALADVTAALALVPNEPWALAARARALAVKGDSGARAAYEAAIARRGGAPRLVLEGARLLQDAGDATGALALLDTYEASQRGVRLGGESGAPALDADDRYWLARGELLSALGQSDQALSAFDHAIAARGVLHARAQVAKGALLVQRQQYEPARALLSPLAPEDGTGTLAEAYRAMSELLFAQGDFSAGCQHAFYALARMGRSGAVQPQLHGYVKAVNRRLLGAGKSRLSRLWLNEAQAVVTEH